MFRKVFKYDFLATIKLWSLFAGICLISGVLLGIGTYISSSGFGTYMASTLTSMLGTLGLYCLPVATIVLLVKNYVGTLFSRRGYLTFMLPVKRTTLYWSKVVSAAVYLEMSSLVLLFAIWIASLFYVGNYNGIASELNYLADILRGYVNVLNGFIHINIIMLVEFGFIVGIYELITGFRLAVVPGGGKRIALTIVLIVVCVYTFLIVLLIYALGGILSAAFSASSASAVPEWLQSLYGTTESLAALFGVATFDAVCVIRSLYLIDHRLNLR